MDESAEKLLASNPTHYGWLVKRNQKGKMQRRFCIVHAGYFYYFEDDKCKKPKGVFSLHGYKASEVSSDESAFVVDSPFGVHHRQYYFTASSRLNKNSWISNVNGEDSSSKQRKRHLSTLPNPRVDSVMRRLSPSQPYGLTLMKNLDQERKTWKYDVPQSSLNQSKTLPITSTPFDRPMPTQLIPIFTTMSRQDAESALASQANGTYILRRGSDKEVLSVKYNQRFAHYVILKENELIFIHSEPEPKFHDLKDLLKYYSRYKLPTCDLRLLTPYVEDD